ncbi:MAG TPA: hypothetical protein VI818_02175 [Candidatus Thermoplasmatota archaeon]|nr:hypothetical protein [Candidatus Thermoplasmatota archaeon]
MRARLPFAVAAVVIALAGCLDGTPFGPPEQPRQFFAFGQSDAGFFGLGQAFNGTATQPFEGCFFADVNDDTNVGRIQMVGWLGLDSKVNIDFGLPNGTLEQGGGVLLHGKNVPPTEHPIPFPDAPAEAQTWGNATFELNNGDYDDPVSRNANWTAYFVHFDDGVRRDDDRSVRNMRGGAFDSFAPRNVEIRRGDAEAHIVLRSNEGSLTQLNGTRNFPAPGEPGSGGPITNRNYLGEHFFENRALGGLGRFTIMLQGTGPSLAATKLAFAFVSPGGRVLANVTLGGNPLPTEQKVVVLPLDEVLVYMIRVTGEATAANYRINLHPYADTPLQYEFWWENVTVGNAYDAWEECTRRLDAREWAAPVPNDQSLPRPEGIRLDIILVGIGGGVVVILLLVKLVLDSVKGAEFRKKMRK